jgi:hypothetical protein
MKTKFYLLLLLAVPSVAFAGARTLITATKNNSNWSSVNTWSLSRVPQSGDSIVIPTNTSVTFDQSYSLNNVYITIAGTLDFNQNNSLALDAASVVSILGTGMLTATHPTPNELLSIAGVNKYVGKNDVTLAGPAMATSSTGTSPSGFTANPILLPVTFVSFTADRGDNGAVQLTWNTTNEINNSHFEIQRSIDGSDWTPLGTVAAGGNSSADSYTFTDENAPAAQTMYRIMQVDQDGKSMYSKITMAGATANAQALIIATGRTVTILPEKLAGSRLMIRVITLGGQVLQQQTFESASSRIDLSLTTANNGIYLVQVTDGSQWSVVKKVML